MTVRQLSQRLSFRQAVISVVVAAVVGLVFTLANLAIELGRERDRIATLVNQTRNAMLAPAARAAFMLDPALAESIGAGLVSNGIFAEARIVADNGRVLATAGQPPKGQIGDFGRLLLGDLGDLNAPLVFEHRDPVTDAATPIPVGMLVAELDEQIILARMTDRVRTMLLFGAVQALILGVVLALVYQIILSQPILDVAEDLRKVDPRAPAAAQVRVPRGHRLTEIGFLVGKTNAVLRQFAATLRKSERIQRELGRERAQLDGIMQSVVDGIVTTDTGLRVERINRAASILFGEDEAAMRGRPLRSLFAETDGAAIDAALAEAASQRAVAGVQREVTAVDRSGRAVPVSVGISRMRVGTRRSFVCVVRDITAQKLTEQRLAEALREAENANRAKSQFLATMSHELRTPLNAIIGFSDMIRSELLGPVGIPAYVEYARDISDSGSHLLSIINDILDISKIEAGQATIDPELLDADETIVGCVGLIRHQADAAGVRLSARVEDGCPALYADSRSVKQIIINLLSNAVKFTAAGGEVRVIAGPTDDGGVRITIADTGIGIAEKDLPRIWRPFEQVENALSRRQGGTGLGLPLVRRLADLHRARITLESRLGEGTTIAIEFPPPSAGRAGGAGRSGARQGGAALSGAGAAKATPLEAPPADSVA